MSIEQRIADKLEEAERRFEELGQLMAQPEAASDLQRLQALGKEQAALEGLASRYRDYKKLLRSLEETRALLEAEGDGELKALAQEEVKRLEAQSQRLLGELRLALVPKDPHDTRDVIVEIRAGAGGEEAALFAADLFRMYSRYAEAQGWQVEVIDTSESSTPGGFKEVILEVKGKGAYSRLKFERGVHRVQRVPVTEASGRIHTSTATVAVLPEADEVEVDIKPDDLKIDIFHASGHGGQNVQKVATAVRITHLPSGITATCQDERSQLRNKQKAMAVLRARLFEQKQRRQQEEISQARRAQVGTGERSEKVRTYNFLQDRVTDHRVNLSLHNLPAILNGKLDELLQVLASQEQAELLEKALA